MANNILGFQHTETAVNLYALIRDRAGKIFDATTDFIFETYATVALGDYDIALTEQGTASRFYTFTIPSQVAAGTYFVSVYKRAGGSPAEGDTLVAAGEFDWDGAAIPGSPLRPTTEGRTADVALTGEVGLDFNNVLSSQLCTLHSLTITGALSATNASNDVRGVKLHTTQSPVTFTGTGSTPGLAITGGATADAALLITGGSTSGDGVKITVTSGIAFETDDSGIKASIDGSLSGSVGSVSGDVGGNVQGSTDSVTQRVTANSDQIGGSSTAATNAKNFWDGAILATGTAQSGDATHIQLAAGSNANNDFYKDAVVTITAGTGVGQSRQITGYVGATKTAAVDTAWVTNPGATSEYQIMGRIV